MLAQKINENTTKNDEDFHHCIGNHIFFLLFAHTYLFYMICGINSIFSGGYLLDPFTASKSQISPYSLNDLIGLEENIYPERRNLKNISSEKT